MKKQRYNSKKIIINSTLSLALIAAGLFSIQPIQNAYADKSIDQLTNEINALQSQIDDAQSQVNNLSEKTKTLQSELEGIAKERSVIESQIKISQAQYDKLQLEISQTEKSIEDNRKALGSILTEMSLEDDVTPIERIAGSDNISTALDSFEYKSAVKTSLTKKVGEIKESKKTLETKRDEVKVAIANQQKSEDALKSKITQQNELIAKTKGEQAEYEKYAEERGNEKLKLQKQQQEAIQAAMVPPSSGGGSAVVLPGTSGGYPWNDSNCYVDANAWSYGGIDGNGTDGMGYGCRQCVSYVAWKLYAVKGTVAANWGNANQWPSSARAAGFSTGATPRAGSAAVISAGAYGHIVWVDAVDGSDVIISQYNYWNAGGSGWGHYSKMRVSASTYDTYIYF